MLQFLCYLSSNKEFTRKTSDPFLSIIGKLRSCWH